MGPCNNKRRAHYTDDTSIVETVKSSSGIKSLGGGCSRNPMRRISKIRPLSCAATATSGYRGDEISAKSSVSHPQLQEEELLERMEKEGQELLRLIRHGIATHIMEQEAVVNDITVHMDRSKARLASQNSIGAVISVRKVKRLQFRQIKLTEALQFLCSQEESLQTRIEETKATVALRGFSSTRQLYSSSSPDDTTKFDLSAYRDVSKQVQQILSAQGNEDESQRSEDLLEELSSMTSPSHAKTRMEI